MPDTIDMSIFRQRLAETIAWCAPRASVADPVNSLRTPALRPVGFDFVVDEMVPFMADTETTDASAIVDAVAQARSRLLDLADRDLAALAVDQGTGKLLLAAPHFNFLDGASKYESHGFFDSDDTPPWDTWVWFVSDETATEFYDSYIVSWVPPQFVRIVNAAIRVSFVDTIAWAAAVDSAFTRQLRAAGVL